MTIIESFGDKFFKFNSVDELTDVLGFDLMEETIQTWKENGFKTPFVISESLMGVLTSDEDDEDDIVIEESDLVVDEESWSKEGMVEITTKHKYYDC